MSVGAVNKQTGDRIPTAGMPAIDDALDLTSVNPVQNAIVTAALALKQDKTDNSLQTTDKTVVGAVNELKSGLINLTNDVKLNTQDLTTPSRTKNLLPMTVDGIKAKNTTGTWNNNEYTANDLTFTINTDNNGYITGITINGTASAETSLVIMDYIAYPYNTSLTVSGCPAGGSAQTYNLQWWLNGVGTKLDLGDGVTFTTPGESKINSCAINIKNGISMNNAAFHPMIRPATITDPTFAPYIPSVESRIEAVESGLDNVQSGLTDATTVFSGTITPQEGVTITNYRLQKSIKTVYLYMLVKLTPTPGTAQLLCVLPSGYRAQDRILFVGYNGTSGKRTTCEVDSWGAVRVHPTSDDSTAVPTDYFLTITYFTS